MIPTKFETVMIIDDNQIDRYITSRLIKKNGFGNEVLEFAAASEALQYMLDNVDNADRLPEVIFVDIYMPMMSGFEFMDAYSNLPTAIKMRCKAFIISSTIDDNDISKVSMNPDIVAFHQKPVTKEFLETIAAGD